MNRSLVLAVLSLLWLCGCNSKPPDTASSGKVEGPPVAKQSHEQLMALYAECTRYGRMDDPDVKYTARYCSAVNSAQQMEGYAASAPRKIDPNPVKLH